MSEPAKRWNAMQALTKSSAKDAARQFVAAHLTDDAKIVRIAEGKMTITFTGPDTAFDVI